MTNKVVKGRFKPEEVDYIKKWYGSKTAKEIARDLGRKEHSVNRWLLTNKFKKEDAPRRIDSHFVEEQEDRVLLQQLSDKLLDDEIRYAETTYASIVRQFGSEIVYSDKLQIIDFCITACLLNRAIADEKQLIIQLKSIQKTRDQVQKDLDKKRKKREADEDEEFDEDLYLERISDFDMRVGETWQGIQAAKKAQSDLMKAKDTITKALNASRSQRADQLSKANSSWEDTVKFYSENKVERESIGYEIEKMRIGIKEEYIRLTSSPHMYVDGESDYPILNDEVIEQNKVQIIDKNTD